MLLGLKILSCMFECMHTTVCVLIWTITCREDTICYNAYLLDKMCMISSIWLFCLKQENSKVRRDFKQRWGCISKSHFNNALMGKICLQWDLNTHLSALLNRDVLKHLLKNIYILRGDLIWVGFESTPKRFVEWRFRRRYLQSTEKPGSVF